MRAIVYLQFLIIRSVRSGDEPSCVSPGIGWRAEASPAGLFGAFAGIHVAQGPEIAHDAGPDFAAGTFHPASPLRRRRPRPVMRPKPKAAPVVRQISGNRVIFSPLSDVIPSCHGIWESGRLGSRGEAARERRYAASDLCTGAGVRTAGAGWKKTKCCSLKRACMKSPENQGRV